MGLFTIESNHALGFVIILAMVLLFTKLFGLFARRIGLPQVLGYIIAGIFIGPAIFGDFLGFSLIGFEGADYYCLFALENKNALSLFSKIGVILLMFSAGLETNLDDIKNTGLTSILIACAGVAVPMVLGILISLPFSSLGLGPENIFRCIFIGAILTATSVAITVSVLKELGKINSKLGTTIVSAAIIDDVIGIIVLSICTGIANAGQAAPDATAFEAFKATIYGTIIMIVAFFIVAIGVGFLASKAFNWLENHYPHTHRLPMFSLVLCFVYAWVAEEVFGVADITGAFLAGIVLSTVHRKHEQAQHEDRSESFTQYVDKKIEVNTYTIFAPVFFANIGISTITFQGLSGMLIVFSLLAVLLGLLGKIVGCGAVCKAFGYDLRESTIGGVGMMARGEVALIVTQTASAATLGANALLPEHMIMTVLLILFSSILTPILLKTLYAKEKSAQSVPSLGGSF